MMKVTGVHKTHFIQPPGYLLDEHTPPMHHTPTWILRASTTTTQLNSTFPVTNQHPPGSRHTPTWRLGSLCTTTTQLNTTCLVASQHSLNSSHTNCGERRRHGPRILSPSMHQNLRRLPTKHCKSPHAHTITPVPDVLIADLEERGRIHQRTFGYRLKALPSNWEHGRTMLI